LGAELLHVPLMVGVGLGDLVLDAATLLLFLLDLDRYRFAPPQ
jgi:hypothetical protein